MPTKIVISSSNSKWINIALAFLSLGLLLFIIGFSTSHWVVYGHQHTGLWEKFFCTHRVCYEVSAVSRHNADWFKACQALETLGLIALLLAFIILFLYMFVETCRGRNALLAIMICTFAGVAFIIIGVIIFNTKKAGSLYEIGWSMGLAIAGAVFAFIAGVMVVLGYLGK
ncbi:XP_029637759.1uncharacterized protein LOC115213003 isoform X2 [Octopus vulgaris]|uniref:XP_029637759.1uncharacterized protein LOC115213003 isoform X2 n=2 Tax=Octopus TaxID=6643 RepID=A0AA36AYL8_OCTVU|nr:uncharacterized protein LOC115213003 isoform X2 [Octopus sinensis]CAI9723971.1 XP_029637759.1uncharacterized protein LOC115213003 isoform X2 [Octopus vulgaris]